MLEYKKKWPVLAAVEGDRAGGESRGVLNAGEILLHCQAKSGVDDVRLLDGLPNELVTVGRDEATFFMTYPMRSLPLPPLVLDGVNCSMFVLTPTAAEGDRSAMTTILVQVHERNLLGKLVMIGEVGARAVHRFILVYHVRGAKPPSCGGRCLSMAMVDAVEAVCSAEDAALAQRALNSVFSSIQ